MIILRILLPRIRSSDSKLPILLPSFHLGKLLEHNS